ncbi:MAG: Hydroxylamine reductase [Syntrophus sp. SKADARSKE-3]|nr:Hydroxylamine reductase [Syntrophus sp. SKADARSKE-3]
MFCFQCEQTLRGIGCIKAGVCGKSSDVAALQDLLVYALKGLSQVAVEGRKVGINDKAVNIFTVKALFSTLTNVNFDFDRFIPLITECVAKREALKDKIRTVAGSVPFPDGPATFDPAGEREGLIAQGEAVGVQSDPSRPSMPISILCSSF